MSVKSAWTRLQGYLNLQKMKPTVLCLTLVLFHIGSVSLANLQERFLNAITDNLVDDVDQLIAEGVNVNQPITVVDEDDIFSLLVPNEGEEPFVATITYLPLTHAIDCEHSEIVEQLLFSGADVNISNSFGKRPIHYAARLRNEDILRLLLEYGADISIADDEQFTALHFASENNNMEILDLLFSFGAISTKNHEGKTPFHLANFRIQPDVTRFFLNHNVNIHEKDNDSETVLFNAVRGGVISNVQGLLNAGLDVNEKNSEGDTPFHIACSQNDFEMVKYLFKFVKYIDSVNNQGLTALHVACANSNLDIVSFLLGNNANIEAKDNSIWSPLHHACSAGRYQIVELLLKNGANQVAQNIDGMYPIGLVPAFPFCRPRMNRIFSKFPLFQS